MIDHDKKCEVILFPVSHNRAQLCLCIERALRARLTEAEALLRRIGNFDFDFGERDLDEVMAQAARDFLERTP